MVRFIVVTFVFMGVAFYQLSGGADFEPRGVRPVKEARVAPPVTKTDVTRIKNSQPVLAPRKTSKVTAAKPETPEPDAAAIDAAARLAQSRVNLSDGLQLIGDRNPAQGLQLASLSDGAIGLSTAPPTQETATDSATPEYTPPAPDIREIKGTRVNMRHGPGTNFQVIASLTLGHEVEVLSESGTGWLRLRTRPEGTMGWISASLVSKKAQ